MNILFIFQNGNLTSRSEKDQFLKNSNDTSKAAKKDFKINNFNIGTIPKTAENKQK